MSLIVPGPQPLSVDRWLNDTYQDGVFWTQQYFNGKEQWGGTNQRAVPRALYHVATYATGLTALDFGQVEFATLDRQILYTTVQVLGGLRVEGYDGGLLAASTANGESSARPLALASWLYEYELPKTSRPSPRHSNLSASVVDQLMGVYSPTRGSGQQCPGHQFSRLGRR